MTPAQNVMFRSQNYIPASGGGQALVHAGGWTCTISGTTCTQTLGWTVTSGDFLVVGVSINNGTVTGASASGTAMGLGFDNTFALANSPAATQVNITITGDNGGQASFVVMEFSGLSSTAVIQGTGVKSDIAYGSLNSWSTASYTNPAAGSLVVSCASPWDNGSAITSAAASGAWTLGASELVPSGSVFSIVCEYQLNAASGAYVGTGTTLPTGNFGKFHTNTIGYK
jgi:hypothetical protein